ncbi:hypothetical protein M0802_004419 [Mischocyttarus mexicanus]|nr:hypothetical protein M0802_004419 [Mischocyttarus mexicanus]
MKNKIFQLINFVNKHLYRQKASNISSTNFESALVKTKDQLTNRIKNLNIIQEFKAIPLKPEKPVPHTLVTWWQWYQQLTGLHSIENARQQVILLQDLLIKCQERRRFTRQEEFMLNNKIKEIYSEMLSTRREDPKYVKLTIEENNCLREQSIITEKLILLDEEEKDNFLQLTTAIKEYHDAQTMNSHRYKYVTILATIISAILSFVCSLIYQSKRSEDMKTFLSCIQNNNQSTIKEGIDYLKQHIDEKFSKNNSSNQINEEPQSSWSNITTWTVYGIIIFYGLKSFIGF